MKRLEYLTEPELRELLNGLGNAVMSEAAARDCEPPLFVLLVFNDPKVAQYISNANRESTVAALREAALRLGNKQDVPRC